MTSQDEMTGFIESYDSSKKKAIDFDWNGKHAEEFEDKNQAFRQEVVNVLLEQSITEPKALLRDLYEAEAKWSVESWCVNRNFSRLGEMLLKTGGPVEFEHFINWFARTFDTFGASHAMNIDPILANSLVAEVDRRLETANTKEEKSRLETAKEMFLKYQKGNPGEDWAFLAPGAEVSNIRKVSKFEIWIRNLLSRLKGK
jgi:hypothetical protein